MGDGGGKGRAPGRARRRGSCAAPLGGLAALVLSGSGSGLAPSATAAVRAWEWRNPLPQGNTLYAACFLDDDIGFAVGAGGTIVRSDDGGLTWTLAQTGLPGSLYGLHFGDASHDVAVGIGPEGTGGLVMGTADGGASWHAQATPLIPPLEAVHFANANSGAAVGWGAAVLWTDDGGQTWARRDFEHSAPLDLESVALLGPVTAVAVGTGGTIIRTTDSGAHWTQVPSGTTRRLEGVAFADPLLGCAVGFNGTVLRTTDGGLNWTPRPAATTEWLKAVAFLDADRVVAVGRGGAVILSGDGGLTWRALPSLRTDFLYGATRAGAGGAVAVGVYGAVFRSADGDAPWTSRLTGTTRQLWAVGAFDGAHGIAVGDSGAVLTSDDRGLTWTSRTSGTQNALYGVSLASARVATVVGDNGTILRTEDGGASWSPQTSGTSRRLCDVAMTDSLTAVAVGWSNVVVRTEDGGAHWVVEQEGADDMMQGVWFTGALTGYAVTFWGDIFATTDGGRTWSRQARTYLDLQDVCLVGPRHGYAVGGPDGPGLVRTTDGGLNWIVEGAPLGEYLSGVCFTDTARGVAVGNYALGTLDGGLTWTRQPASAHGLDDVAFFDEDTGVAVGPGGAILRTRTAGWPTAVAPEPEPGRRATLLLRQNRPNPFNPRTTIPFDLPAGGRVRLRVYDAAGRCVRTLRDADLPRGRHEAVWDGRDARGRAVASGSYFARLTADGRVETVRMGLVR